MTFLRRIGALTCAAIIGLLVFGTLAPHSASAHERRDLVGGKYQAVVGFLTEPAYEDQVNGLDFAVTSKTEKNADGTAKPIEGLEKTLKAQVIVGGGKTLDLTLQTRFGMPGKYAAYFVPTTPGQYIFRVYGTINGEQLDERFESGPGRFNDIQALAPLQFPEAAAEVPADLQARLDAAESAANNARIFGLAGIVVGLIGLGLGAAALFRRPASPVGRLTTQPGQGDD
jgi:hypothetical protein